MTDTFRMRSIGRHGMVYGIGVIVNRAVSFIMLPIYTRYLTPADYGILQLVLMALEVISVIAGSRLATGVFHFYHKAQGADEKRAVISTAMLLQTMTYAVAAMGAFAAGPAISHALFGSQENTFLVRVAVSSMALESLVLVPLILLRVRTQSVGYVTVSVVRLFLQLSFNIFFVVVLGWAVKGILIASLIVNIIVGLSLASYVARETGLRFSRRAAGDLIRFGVPMMGTQIATFLIVYSDRYFLQKAADSSVVGVYSLAYQFGMILFALGASPFIGIWGPVRFQIARRPDRNEIYARTFVYFNVLLVTVGVILSLFVFDLLRVMANPAFRPAATIVPVVLIAYLFQGWFHVHDIGIMYREKTLYMTMANWIAAVIAVAGYMVFIPKYYGMAAATVTAVAFGIRQLIVYTASQRLWHVEYRWSPVIRLLGLGVAVALVDLAIPHHGLVSSLAVRTMLLGVYLTGVWFGGVLSPSDRTALRSVMRSPRLAFAAFRR